MSVAAFNSSLSLSTACVTPLTAGAAVCPAHSSFVAKPKTTPKCVPIVPLVMQASKGGNIDPDAYQIQQSEYVDPEGDDDSGDGFVGEEDELDNYLGVAMPEDLASFERKEIENAETREELVDKLRDIRERRRDIMVDRRKGLGMETANDYLGNL